MCVLIAIIGVSLADTSTFWLLWSKLGGKKPVGNYVETSFVWKWLQLVQWYGICPYARHEAILGTKIIAHMNLYFRIRWDWRTRFMTRPLYPWEIGTHSLLIRSLWEPHRWSGRVAGNKNLLPVLGFETRVFPCQAFLDQYIANDIQAANEIISCEVFLPLSSKCVILNPCGRDVILTHLRRNIWGLSNFLFWKNIV
jgi:hypothetical protein